MHHIVGSENCREARVVESQYSPEAVVYWYNHGLEKKRKSNRDMLLKAKKHLAFVGWSFWYARKGNRQELRYSSPRGVVYNSLRTACKACIDEGGFFEGLDSSRKSFSPPPSTKSGGDSPLTESSIASEPRKRGRKRKSGNNLIHIGATDENYVVEDEHKYTKASRVFRLGKRARLEAIPGSSKGSEPRTILSWLIDNNAVLLRAKVHYRGRNGPLAKGRIGRDGIECDCCGEVFTLSGFEGHAGSQKHRPTANIFLDEDGRSLLDCQKQILGNNKIRSSTRKPRNQVEVQVQPEYDDNNDEICSICRYGGELILCDDCPSSFHQSCLGLKDLPTGNWFCSSCCCGICGKGKYEEKTEHSTDDDIVRICGQCEHKFHMGCMKKSRGLVNLSNCAQSKWFCSDRCETISSSLQEILGKPFSLGVDNLTWRLLKSMEHDSTDSHEIESLMENQSRLNVALEVMHECFEPIKDVLTGRDLVEDVIFNRPSDLKRLNFQGFCTVLLERNEEVISAANVRIYEKVAEVPLLATRIEYRRKGMCRVLMNELEKLLIELGVERLMLPAASNVLHTWTTKFGFSQMTAAERLQYLDYTFLDFQGSTMCQKLLRKIPLAKLERWPL
ncbi:Zinc finger, PHD-type [Melia azedarach]|uniref:Zinc finger, PHD-type n=1 Tax=Melia azedarach TaxID=155640 RepID=A0ACC1WRL6_MELAZ|nr:Zinc finger, PHD-type [Melia azedarach]